MHSIPGMREVLNVGRRGLRRRRRCRNGQGDVGGHGRPDLRATIVVVANLML